MRILHGGVFTDWAYMARCVFLFFFDDCIATKMSRSNTLGIVVRTPMFTMPTAPPPAKECEEALRYMDPRVSVSINVTSFMLTSLIVAYNIAYLFMR